MSKVKVLSAAFGAALALSAVGGAFAKPADKVTICHHTGSESNHGVHITVSANAQQAHIAHGDPDHCHHH